MAYETGVASSAEDLIGKLFTFLTDGGIFTTPWTQDNLDNTGNKASIHLGSCYVHFQWTDSPGNAIAVAQSLGFISAGTGIDGHTNDSGNGNGSITSERRAQFNVAGPWTAYHFFAYEGDNPAVYVLVEESTGIFRHAFGFGNAVKYGDWTGGEFAYGCFWNQGASYIDDPGSVWHTLLLDGSNVASQESLGGTMHVEGLPNAPTGHKWGVFVNDTVAFNDGDGNGRAILFGASRGGPWTWELAWMQSSHLNAYKILLPITLWYRGTLDTPDEVIPLGEMPNVAVVNMANFSPGDEIAVGSDTWMVFPWVRKQYLAAGTEESWHGGYAYKKVPNP